MTTAGNESIKQAIVDQLTWDSSVNYNNVLVNVQDGKVELSGTVENMAARMAAERNVQEVKGVIAVDNRLKIIFPPGSKLPDDSELQITVENLLSWNVEIDSDYIKVACNNRVITLSGNVETYWEKLHASMVVSSVKGVLEVNNELNVVPVMIQNDEQIKKEINRAFQRTYLIDEGKIQVEVIEGIVQLSGKVPNFLVKLQARNIAIQTSGVKKVLNHLHLA